MRITSLLLTASLLAAPSALTAEEREGKLDLSLAVSGEARWFPQDPQFLGQLEGVQPSITVEPSLEYQSPSRRHQFVLKPFARLDARDDERTHADLREGYWRYRDDGLELLIGVNRVFWGVTESRHLVNIINQIDAVEDTDEEDFLGQPMISVATQQDWGRIALFVMPGFRERTFPGADGRFRGPLVVDEDAAHFDSDLEQAHPDVALRYAHALGDWDVGAHGFYGHSREPRLTPNASFTAFEPQYDLIAQGGVDIQYTQDAWLWKFEGLVRGGHGDPFVAAVGGLEYTEFQVFETDADLGFLAEFLYDGRDETDAPVTIFDNDVFVGARLSLNDVQDSSVLAGGFIDVETGATGFRLEASRRLGDSWRLELEGQAFPNVADDDRTSAFKRDSNVTLRLTKFF